MNIDDVLHIIYWHTDCQECGSVEEDEWAAQLIQLCGYTVNQLKARMPLSYSCRGEDPKILDDLKRNFPQYRI